MSTAVDRQPPTDDERRMLRDAVRGLLEHGWPASGYDEAVGDPARLAAVWSALVEHGFAALGTDEGDGGLSEVVVVLEELGRAACLAPLLPAVVIGLLLEPRRLDDPAIAALLQDVRAGRSVPALAFGDDGSGPIRLDGYVDRGTISGEIGFVESAEIATHLAILVDDEPSLVVVRLDAPGVTVEPTRAMGASGVSRVVLVGAPAQVIDIYPAEITAIRQVSRLGLAARSYGGTARTFELLLDYVKERRQFGRPIGSFQAIQHKLVNNLIALEGSQLLIEHAARVHDEEGPHWKFYATAAFATASASLRQVALENQHAFGAIGYAEEHEAPRHFKRIHVDLLRHGGVRAARAELAAFYLDGDCAAVPEIDLGPSGNAFRDEVRAWLRTTWIPQRREEFYRRPYKQREYDDRFARELGETGWIGLAWPKEFGGQARTPLERVAFLETMESFEAPKGTAPVAAPMLMKHGTAEQQQRYLPDILNGRVNYGICYSEPGSGSDLASLRTRAVRDGDDWVISGQKIWTTTYIGDYLLVAARTDPDPALRQAGLSLFIVPSDAPGINMRPSTTMYDGSFANIFFDDVRVPHSALVGKPNEGWKVIVSALGTERGFYGGHITMQLAHVFELVCDHLGKRGARPDLGRDPVVRDLIGSTAAQLEVGRRLMVRCAEMAESGVTPPHEAAMSKVFSSELMERFGEATLDVLGLEATLSQGSAGAMLRGRLEQRLRHSLMWVISLGTNEIQRNLIAKKGLGLPG